MARILNKLSPRQMVDRMVGPLPAGAKPGPTEQALLVILTTKASEGTGSIDVTWGPGAKILTREELCDTLLRAFERKPPNKVLDFVPVSRNPRQDVREFALTI